MKFVTFLDIGIGKHYEAIKKFRNPEVPEGIKVVESLWLFGKPDAMMIFEAKDEGMAGKFVIQFSDVADPRTLAAFPIDKLTWIR